MIIPMFWNCIARLLKLFSRLWSPGITYKGKFQDIKSIQALYHEVERYIKHKEDFVTVLALKVNNTYLCDHPMKQEADKLASLIKSKYGSWFKSVKTYGFIYSPPNGTKMQPYHHDFSLTAENIFIPMCDVTDLNSTRYFSRRFKEPKDKFNYPSVMDLISSEGITHLVTHQISAPAFSVLKMHGGTVHRGVANMEDYVRVVFFVVLDYTDIDPKEIDLNNYFKVSTAIGQK